MFEHLKSIENGSLKRAHRMSYDGSLWSAVEDGHVYAVEEIVDGEVFYKDLALTKKGTDLLRFSRLTLKDIDNSYGKNSLKEWLLKPLVLEICKYCIIACIAFLGGAYSTEIKEAFTQVFNPASEQTLNSEKTEK
ncbi:hypothetical protein [Vibrio coralliilyticus]|uniref:hypothetical protein n=1 Tax=Vibrio coralliilyticus TaxID=190893 RepID=UPI001560B345|nr:hypothetical protein [Vibrio coralliilyticus]NRF28367.1 hypothetical protein [Vibrio coralliilyticus]NRF51822.1 hypothetical protein [Vibrio coralliilyticus]NRG06296.1 hypothetical protein [Vibrio coralliilyticus]